MPSVDVAMARSLRGGILGSITASLQSSLGRRQLSNIPNQVNDVRTAFSSWDNCMAVNYCKWPVIALMIAGGLIIISVIWCIVRCACCGLSCCCSCFQCLKCCGNCCGCCDPPKGTPHKYLDEPYIPPHHGYKTQAPMHAPTHAPTHTPAIASASSPPQYAEFDVSRKGDADSLPAMPSWEGAGSKKVMLENDAVELDQLKKPDAAQSSQSVPLMTGGATPGPASPMAADHNNPYGQPQLGPASSGYLGSSSQVSDPYAAPGRGYMNNDPYAQSASSLGTGMDQGYGMAAVGGAAAMGPGRRTPRQDLNDPYAQPQAYNQSRGYQQDYDNGYETGGYGMGAQRRSPPYGGSSPSPAPEGYRRSPAPQGDRGYGSSDQQYAGAAAGYGGRQYPPKPQRQYSSDSSRPLASRPMNDRHYANPEPASPSLQSNSGFDFSSGYSRPQEYNYNRQASGPQQPQPQQQQANTSDYPGYKAYQPAQQGWSGV